MNTDSQQTGSHRASTPTRFRRRAWAPWLLVLALWLSCAGAALAQSCAVSPASLPDGTVGAAYSQAITSAGLAPYTFSVSAGALPAGLTLAAGGTLSGTPTIVDISNFTITVYDSASCTDSQAYTVAVAAATITLAPASLPGGTSGTVYSQTVTASGGTAPYTFAVTAGSLPTGLVLTSAGAVSGTPAAAGTYGFTITATDAYGSTGAQLYSVVIAAPAISLSPGILPGGTIGTVYSETVTASGGTAPYTFAVTTGSLPAGLALTSAGVVSGTPATAGTYGFTITATDAYASTGSQLYSVVIAAPAISLSPGTLPGGTTAVAYSQTVTASGGSSPYSFAVTAGSLPTGLALTSAGVLSGTPTAAGTYGFTITATDAFGSTGAQAYSVGVMAPAIVLAPAALPAGQAGTAYSQTISASGGVGPYIFSLTSGTLPDGLALATDGTLSGTPTAPGAPTFTVTATDSNGAIGSRSYTLTIANGVVPVAVSKQVSTQMDIPVQVDLTLGASGGPFTSATVISVGPGGTATVSPGEVLTFTPSQGFLGSVQVDFTLSNAWGPSAVASITFVVGARLDPVKDPDVVGIQTATDGVVRIFAENPMRNVDRRMDTLHDLEKGCGWWVSETTRSGSRGADAVGSSQSFRVNGVTFGGDCPTSHHLSFGVALGYDRNRQDIGIHGSHLYGQAKSGMGYGSFHPTVPFFIDGSIGHQRITLQTMRALPGSQSVVEGQRTGDQTFSSWTGGYRLKRKTWEINAYSRVDVAKASLDGYSEDGDPTQALRYGDESIETRTNTLGIRGKFQHESRWGMVEPRMRVEFLHDFHLQGGTSVQYVDQPNGAQYLLAPQVGGGNRQLLELGVVLNTRLLTLNLQYLAVYGGLYGNDRAWTLTFENSR